MYWWGLRRRKIDVCEGWSMRELRSCVPGTTFDVAKFISTDEWIMREDEERLFIRVFTFPLEVVVSTKFALNHGEQFLKRINIMTHLYIMHATMPITIGEACFCQ
jgi:hypothetical protein